MGYKLMVLALFWGPQNPTNLPGTIQFKSPFSTRYNKREYRQIDVI